MADDLGTIDTSQAETRGALVNDTVALQQAEAERATALSTQSELSAIDPQAAASATATAEIGADVRSGFQVSEPQEHFDTIMKQAPLLMALAAIGGSFGRMHGMTMLASTNAMMKGIVQGSDAAYSQARQKYDMQYQEYKEKSKTWFDVYKSYLTAYKGRIDVNEKAVAAANAAVGMAGRNMQMDQKNILMMPKLEAQIADINSKIGKRTHDEARDDIRDKQGQERIDVANRNAKTREDELANRVKTSDTNTLSAEARSINTQLNTLLKQYPPSKGDLPPEVKVQLDSYHKQLDIINEKLEEHKTADFQAHEQTYKEARAAIAAGADPIKVKKRLSEAGLNPDQI